MRLGILTSGLGGVDCAWAGEFCNAGALVADIAKKIAGMARQRKIPAFARETFRNGSAGGYRLCGTGLRPVQAGRRPASTPAKSGHALA